MEFKSLIVPILLIGFGIFIKETKIEGYQSAKKWWKILVILGVINLSIRIIGFLLF
jgi:hypothetical protein